MNDYPHVRAAFINAIAEEGTKAEAVKFLQEQWNENCALREQIVKLEGERDFEAEAFKGMQIDRDFWKGRAEVAEQQIVKLTEAKLDECEIEAAINVAGDTPRDTVIDILEAGFRARAALPPQISEREIEAAIAAWFEYERNGGDCDDLGEHLKACLSAASQVRQAGEQGRP